MKLTPRDAAALFARPTADKAAMLIYGADGMRVSLKRQDFLKGLLGPEAEEEMRLTRLAAGDLRKDKAALLDAVKAVGFFPGPRAVLVDDIADGLAPIFDAALADWLPGDAMIVATAGSLAARSKLRKLFESHLHAWCAAIYADPPSRAEIDAELKKVGVQNIDPAALQDIELLARNLDPGDFRQTVEKLALYKLNDSDPLTSEEVLAMAPATLDAELDDLLNAAAEGQTKDIGPLMSRLDGQGIQPVFMCITATRHFRTLHVAASDPKGAGAGIAKMRPPVFGPRRDRMIRQAQDWGMRKLESALEIVLETDLSLRSANRTAPELAVVERMLIRLSMLRSAR